MLVGRRSGLAVVLSTVIVASAGCAASSPTPSESPSSATASVVLPTAVGTPAPTATIPVPSLTPEGTPEPTLSLQPTPTPEQTEPPQPASTPIPTPRPIQPAGWTSPQVAISSTGCGSVDLLVDASGGEHVVADCDDLVHYAASQGDGRWSSVVFSRAGGVVDRNPLLALDGDRLYAAYSQAVEEGGCGGGWFTKVGVFVRSRVLPNGAWSAAQRIGPVADQLDSFAVHGGVMDLVVTTLDRKTYLETAGGGSVRRYALAGDEGSVAVAPDGQVGVAYASDVTLRYGTLTGTRLSSVAVKTFPASVPGLILGPDLAFDAAGHAAIGFELSGGPGCAGGGEPSAWGAYEATNTGGSWSVRHVTRQDGATDLALDPHSGAVDMLVDGTVGEAIWGSLSLYTSTDGQSWKHTELVSQMTRLTALATDPVTGRPVVAYREPIDSTTDRIAVIAQR